MKRIADKYANLCGYRQHGLKYDDLIIEENETVQTVSVESVSIRTRLGITRNKFVWIKFVRAIARQSNDKRQWYQGSVTVDIPSIGEFKAQPSSIQFST